MISVCVVFPFPEFQIFEIPHVAFFFFFKLFFIEGFPGCSDGKASACHARDLGSIPGLGRSPEKGNGNPLQYSFLENPRGRGAWLGYSPWGHKEADTTE